MSPQTRRVPLGARLLLLFTLIPLLEFCILIWLWHATSFMFTLAVVLISGALGATMARYQGIAVWRQSQREMAMGRFPADPLLDGLIILVGGALLVTPGLITDFAGFSTLIPPLRAVYRQWLKRALRGKLTIVGGLNMGPGGGFHTRGRPSVEEKVRVVTPDEPPAGSPFEEKSPFDKQT